MNRSTEFMSDPNSISSWYLRSSRGRTSFSVSVRNEKSLVAWRDWSRRIFGSLTFLLRSFWRMASALLRTKKRVREWEYSTARISFFREYSFNLFISFSFYLEFRKDILSIFFWSALIRVTSFTFHFTSLSIRPFSLPNFVGKEVPRLLLYGSRKARNRLSFLVISNVSRSCSPLTRSATSPPLALQWVWLLFTTAIPPPASNLPRSYSSSPSRPRYKISHCRHCLSWLWSSCWPRSCLCLI